MLRMSWIRALRKEELSAVLPTDQLSPVPGAQLGVLKQEDVREGLLVAIEANTTPTVVPVRAASPTPARATSPTPASVPTISVAVAASIAASAAKPTATAAAPPATPGPSTADLSQTIADSLASLARYTHRLAQTVEEGFQKLSSQTASQTALPPRLLLLLVVHLTMITQQHRLQRRHSRMPGPGCIRDT
ncbi:uncharacterized protein LOC115628650 [Scaptodrosophila lebanonensis]|uniref:Uncharacterized protein LOC115628650 n=1 Tax=Drosophila lebanonensis TaxID=7225 RepID=A0A6J2TX25_DROLE|nr:uncharacterized protein LOC115628650 [Scaptodrosophila lebanonensis]